MSNGMRSCTQGAREAVIALHCLVAFCHKKLGLLNKHVLAERPAPKLKVWGKRQDLTLAIIVFVGVLSPVATLASQSTVAAKQAWSDSCTNVPGLYRSGQSTCDARL